MCGQPGLQPGNSLIQHPVEGEDVIDLLLQHVLDLTKDRNSVGLVRLLLQDGVLQFQDGDLGKDQLLPDALDQEGLFFELATEVTEKWATAPLARLTSTLSPALRVASL